MQRKIEKLRREERDVRRKVKGEKAMRRIMERIREEVEIETIETGGEAGLEIGDAAEAETEETDIGEIEAETGEIEIGETAAEIDIETGDTEADQDKHQTIGGKLLNLDYWNKQHTYLNRRFFAFLFGFEFTEKISMFCK